MAEDDMVDSFDADRPAASIYAFSRSAIPPRTIRSGRASTTPSAEEQHQKLLQSSAWLPERTIAESRIAQQSVRERRT